MCICKHTCVCVCVLEVKVACRVTVQCLHTRLPSHLLTSFEPVRCVCVCVSQLLGPHNITMIPCTVSCVPKCVLAQY